MSMCLLCDNYMLSLSILVSIYVLVPLMVVSPLTHLFSTRVHERIASYPGFFLLNQGLTGSTSKYLDLYKHFHVETCVPEVVPQNFPLIFLICTGKECYCMGKNICISI